ncbi:hypothetical protein U14_03459 [Candidatus Moduliflexus flocculans]|uniref:ABC transporter substrate-binding protein n=1 Tax=Candidatus Moduliflexus flocculans TaxID=1499966 RepID=A0A081BP92_9BACT|nr:hypothetical protein U14_03459 [Candidatus Moduliflexus flocculans]
MIRQIGQIFLLLVILSQSASPAAHAQSQKKCLEVGSYHQDYAWQNAIDGGIAHVLQGHCELRVFYLDSKREPSPEAIQKKALEAKALIDSWQPDVVIATDDNASRYLVKPYFKDAAIPFVFCGINWTVDEYGYPYSNATGMTELAPIRQAFEQIKRIVPVVKQGTCMYPGLESEKTACERYAFVLKPFGVEFTLTPVETMHAFEEQFKALSDMDFIFFSNNSSIKDWDAARAKQIVQENAKVLTLTMDEWMTPFVMLGFTQVGNEQGEYAASTALKILEGTKPSEIAIVPNRQWNLFVNEGLLEKAGITIPRDLLQKGKKVE